MKIFCVVKLNSEEKEYLLQSAGNAEVFFQDELAEDTLNKFLDCDVCFGNPPCAWVEQSEKLNWLQLESVGYEPYLSLKSQSMRISNLKGFFSIPVAESALAGILSLMRGVNTLSIHKKEKNWKGAVTRPSLRILEGSHVLILGAGAIGYQLKKLLLGFNCRVSFYDKFNSQAEYTQTKDLDKALPEVDMIIGCLPETPETIHFINEARLSRMKPTSIVVNVGRGSLIDEEALIQKLNEESIAGAVLDVTEKEPLPREHPLWNCPNTILTQHTGGGWEDEISGKIKFFSDNYDRYIRGENLIGIVDS